MVRSRSDRVRRAVAAGVVLLAHVVVVWIFVHARVERVGEKASETIVATLIEQPRPRNFSIGPISVQVKYEDVVHLQRFAPKIQDVPVEEPERPLTWVTVPEPASAPLPQQAKAGMEGDSRDSSGKPGGGTGLVLLQRVIPKYPVEAARRREVGVTEVNIHVDASGSVRDVRITRSSGSRSLDRSAIAAFRQWKFAPMPAGYAPNGVWLETRQRFIIYRFTYSRLSDKAANEIDVAAVQPATVEPTPGSQQALMRFIDEVGAGTVGDKADFTARTALRSMRDALEEWGAVQSIEFTGTAGPRGWTPYRVRRSAADPSLGPTVEVSWNLFEVRLEHATTEWLVGVGRDGTVWDVRASPAPWL